MKRTGELKRTMPLKRGSSTMSRTTGLKPRSKAQDAKESRYRPLRDAYMAAHPQCEFRECAFQSMECHHKAKKIGENRYRHLMALCIYHHCWIHSNTAEARELGYLFTDDPRRVD